MRSGEEVALVVERLYERMFRLAVLGVSAVVVIGVLVAPFKVREDHLLRTVLLAVALVTVAAVVLRSSAAVYRALRRRPLLLAFVVVLFGTVFVVDGALHTTFYAASCCVIALAALTASRRATMLTGLGLATAFVLAHPAAGHGFAQLARDGDLALVLPGAAAYVAWAAVFGGLVDRLAGFVGRLNAITVEDAPPRAPVRVRAVQGTGVVESVPVPAPPETLDPPTRAQLVTRLTARQLQVVALLCDGFDSAAVAERLGITTATVYDHVRAAKRRLGVATRAELVLLAVAAGVVPPPE